MSEHVDDFGLGLGLRCRAGVHRLRKFEQDGDVTRVDRREHVATVRPRGRLVQRCAVCRQQRRLDAGNGRFTDSRMPSPFWSDHIVPITLPGSVIGGALAAGEFSGIEAR